MDSEAARRLPLRSGIPNWKPGGTVIGREVDVIEIEEIAQTAFCARVGRAVRRVALRAFGRAGEAAGRGLDIDSRAELPGVLSLLRCLPVGLRPCVLPLRRSEPR